jgi:hypothetical protein
METAYARERALSRKRVVPEDVSLQRLDPLRSSFS